nr:hypothetical protein [Herbaspirillum sp. ASV7]
MNNKKTAVKLKLIVLLGLFAASLSMAIAQSVEAAQTQSNCQMREYSGQVETLKKIEGPIDLLRVARTAYERPLLLDPEFFSDSNIEKVFGITAIKNLSDEKDPWTVTKEVKTGLDSGLQSRIVVMYSTYTDINPPDHHGWILIRPQEGSTIYNADLIKESLVFDMNGIDDLKNQALNYPDIHARESYSRRSSPAHPEGYFTYKGRREADCYTSRISVRLKGDGTLSDIQIHVDEKRLSAR